MKTYVIRCCIAIELIACLTISFVMYYNVEHAIMNVQISHSVIWITALLGGIAYITKGFIDSELKGFGIAAHLMFGAMLLSIGAVELWLSLH